MMYEKATMPKINSHVQSQSQRHYKNRESIFFWCLYCRLSDYLKIIGEIIPKLSVIHWRFKLLNASENQRFPDTSREGG